ncbi:MULTISPECIES: hypothetical protein [Gordonia]|uniref:Uncharacterized protein n=1 Tax=Gordonia amicalis TaxID=89053 RepID=A0ABU4D8I4_9ACTN|nr:MULTISPECIES: hypothetical protein [Gordonia]ATD70740.1 hypothetical protein CNO18_11160 [Gordonia sp. 1D]MDV6306044.1 hypothetical protein [Gordonia amicalis]
MTVTTLSAPETLIRHAWDLYEQEPTGPYAEPLRTAVWELEEAVDHGSDDLPRLGREVVQALTLATGDEVDELLTPMPGVAAWLGL